MEDLRLGKVLRREETADEREHARPARVAQREHVERAVERVAAGYPDPGKVPRYYESPCFAQFDRRFVHDYEEREFIGSADRPNTSSFPPDEQL